jgi:hypothetical protein
MLLEYGGTLSELARTLTLEGFRRPIGHDLKKLALPFSRIIIRGSRLIQRF